MLALSGPCKNGQVERPCTCQDGPHGVSQMKSSVQLPSIAGTLTSWRRSLLRAYMAWAKENRRATLPAVLPCSSHSLRQHNPSHVSNPACLRAGIVITMLCVASSACRAAYPLYFLAGLSALVLLVVSAKLHSIATHLGAMSILDYGDKLDVYVEQQKAGFGGCVMHRGCQFACHSLQCMLGCPSMQCVL